jgi:hypothetical protein
MAFSHDFPESYANLLPDGAADDGFFDLRKIMAKVTFDPSSPLGLRLVDVLASAFRRAVSGNLQPHGWEPLGQLLICQEKIVRVLALMAETGQPPEVESEPLLKVLGR